MNKNTGKAFVLDYYDYDMGRTGCFIVLSIKIN